MPTISVMRPEDVTAAAATDVSELMSKLAGAPRAIGEDDLLAVARRNHLLAATIDARVVGVVCLVPMHLPQGVRLWIESVIVDPEHRGRGIGRKLMEAALEIGETYGDVPVSLTSNPTRSVAHRLFEQLGFSRADTSVFRRPWPGAPEKR